MFYKENQMASELKEHFFKDYPLEFAYALHEKTRDLPGYSLAAIAVPEKIILPVILYENRGRSEYWSSKGVRNANFERNLPAFLKDQYPEAYIRKYSHEEIANMKLNEEKLNEAQALVRNIFIIKNESDIVDKLGESYQIKIIKDADPTISSYVVVDKLVLIKNGEEIGFVKVKYTTPEIVKKLGMQANEMFLDIATIDYSWLEHDYRNRGLGYSMYVAIAKHLKSEGLRFRSSMLQSSQAKQLWSGIHEHFARHIEFDTINNTQVAFLTIGEDCMLYFNQGKPELKKHGFK